MVKPFGRFSEVSIRHNMVAIKDRSGLMTSHLHRHPIRYPGPYHVADGCPPEVMGTLPLPRDPNESADADGDALLLGRAECGAAPLSTAAPPQFLPDSLCFPSRLAKLARSPRPPSS